MREEKEASRKVKADAAKEREAKQRSEYPKHYASNRANREPLDYRVIILERNHEDKVARITLNRPEVMNALSHELRGELFHALKVCEYDEDINAIILRGAGRAFSAGYDIGGGMGIEEPDSGSQFQGNSHWARYLIATYWQIWEHTKIVICQAHGYCLAGASEIMSMCDLMVVTPNLRVGYPPVRAMQAPDIMWMPWLLPKRVAAELVYTGDNITGERMHHFGMANHCVPQEDIDEFTYTYAKRVALLDWRTNTLHKRGFNKAYEIMGIRTAEETHALQWDLLGHTPQIQYYSKLIQEVPLREYLTVRDGKYRDYRTQEEAIQRREKREGEAWKAVKEVGKKLSDDVDKTERVKSESSEAKEKGQY